MPYQIPTALKTIFKKLLLSIFCYCSLISTQAQTKTINIDFSSYSAAGLTSVCNVFAGPTAVNVLINGVPGYTLTHTAILGTTRYISSTGTIDLPTYNVNNNAGGTGYAISYPFQNGYTYAISVTASSNNGNAYLQLYGLITNVLPGTSPGQTCYAQPIPSSFANILNGEVHGTTSTVTTFNFQTSTLSSTGYNYLVLLGTMPETVADIKSVSIYKVQIVETAPASISCSLPAPTGLSVSTNTDYTSTLSWSAVSGAFQYKINLTDVHNGVTNTQTLYSSTNSLSYCAAGNGDNITYTVQAICPNDMLGTASAAYSFQAPTPAAPTGLAYNFVNCNRLEWTPVSGATAYTLQIQDLTAGTPVSVINGISSYGVSIEKDLNLISGHNYKAAVAAVGANGCNYQGAYTSWYNFTAISPLLTVPTGISYNGNTNVLSWSAVTNATNYYIQYQDLTTNSVISTFNMYSQNSTSGTNLSLVNGHQYRVSIDASLTGCAYQSPYSPWYTFTAGPPPPPTCMPPTIMQLQPLGNGNLEVLFLAPSSGPTPSSYNIRLDLSGTSTMYNNVGSPTSVVISVPSRGASYTVNMQSVCPLSSSTFVSRGPVVVNGISPQSGGPATIGNAGQIVLADDDAAAVKVYPVPSSGNINISLTASQNGKAEITVFNTIGVPVLKKVVGTAVGVNSYSLNAGQLAAGVYSIKIVEGKNVRVRKLVIQK